MDETGETCKLCLKYIQGANLAILEETLLGKLEFLLMDLEQSVDDSNSVCKECEDKIENAFEFKSCLVNTESCLAPYVSEDRTQKVNLKVILEKDSPGTSAEKDVCRLCKNFTNSLNVISLTKILKDDSITEIFQGHIPEMDLHVTENPMVCESCQKSLDSFSALVASWSIAIEWNVEDMKDDIDNIDMIQVKEENINELTETNTNSSVDINDISGSAQTYSKSKRKYEQDVEVKKEIDDVPDSIENVSGDNTAIKKEEENEEDGSGDTEMGHLQLKNEEIDIKDEDGYAAMRELYFKVNSNAFEEVHIHRCLQCSYQTTSKINLTRHLLVQNLPKKEVSFTCQECLLEMKSKVNLERHLLVHKDYTEIETFNCQLCHYQAKYKGSLTRHMKTHQNYNEVAIFQCPECPHKSKSRGDLKKHMNTHSRINESDVYKCQQCSFGTRSKSVLTIHVAKAHNNWIPLFICHLCNYQTKHKRYMERHEQVHEKTINQGLIYQINSLEMNRKRPKFKRRHRSQHPEFSSIPLLKCQQCDYETKKKLEYERHIFAHKLGDEMEILKCQQCSYETTNVLYFKKHLFIHESSTDTPVFKCHQCCFETKRKSNLKLHLRRMHSKKTDECIEIADIS